MRRHAIAAAALVAVLAGAPGAAAGQTPEPDGDFEAAAGVAIPTTGHGFGHGRGMGQYGSLGYALNAGWTSGQILNHFYGNTQSGSVDPNSQMTVRLLAQDGIALVVRVDNAVLATIADAGAPFQAPGHALRIEQVGPNAFAVADGENCAGPWTPRPGPVGAAQIRVLAALPGGTTFGYGLAGDRPVAGDWNRDGIDSIGVYRGGTWFLRNANSNGPTDASFGFGLSGDLPVVGDWNGDGIDSAGVFRDGTWYLRSTNTNGPPDAVFGFGLPGDLPVVGDWNGDGFDSVGVFRGGTFYLRNFNNNGPPDAAFGFGLGGDIPVVGDWDGNRTTTVGVRRSTTYYLRNSNSNGPPNAEFTFGNAGGFPIAGAWTGGSTDIVGWMDAGTFKLAGQNAPNGGFELLTGSDNALDQTLQVCGAGTDAKWYRGELRAVSDAGVQRAVNAVALDQYIRGVVPRESPSTWGALGCDSNPCRGLAALEAQAVAARSYSVAENRYPYAKTCDTIACQVYQGRFQRVNGAASSNETANTDKAVANTAGVVRLRSGVIARTEFSSSTGGQTAGGVFPSVVDEGDNVSQNQNHNWSELIPVASIEATYNKGTLVSITVSERTPEDGNRRAKTVHIVFSGGVVDVPGDTFRSTFDLRSTWFSFAGSPALVSTVGVFRDGIWYLRNTNTNGPPDATFGFGLTGDLPAPGDWNGDGIDTVGVFRGGTWYLRNSNTNGPPDATLNFGLPGDLPVTGDWNGDGIVTVGVYRGGTWYLRNSNTSGPPDATFGFGLSGDVAVAGDWNADGVDSIGVFRDGTWYMRNANNNGPPDATFGFGLPGDRPVGADWNGDGFDTPGVFRDGTWYLRNVNTNGPPDASFGFGLAGDRPAGGVWK